MTEYGVNYNEPLKVFLVMFGTLVGLSLLSTLYLIASHDSAPFHKTYKTQNITEVRQEHIIQSKLEQELTPKFEIVEGN